MDDYLKSNRELWNAWTRIHVKSEFYDVDGFRSGANRLDSIVREGVGDVRGKSLLHLQCHFGLDTLNWARLGARVTGVDFSDEGIREASKLSAELGIPARFIQSDIYDLPGVLDEEFDIVFTSYGALYWLPDLERWAQIVARFLKPGGIFFVAEAHPLAMIFDDDNPTDLRVRFPYFNSSAPLAFPVKGSYAARDDDYTGVEYGWCHSLDEVLGGLLRVGLAIRAFREYPFICWKMFPFLEQDADSWWRLPEPFPQIPLMFSLKADKPR